MLVGRLFLFHLGFSMDIMGNSSNDPFLSKKKKPKINPSTLKIH